MRGKDLTDLIQLLVAVCEALYDYMADDDRDFAFLPIVQKCQDGILFLSGQLSVPGRVAVL